ncbi:XrtN system VIT domain-containing protein [Dyadobacter psychrotolerans]|uniref:XrtN system VIT domain-containing protein n=1 Tax=Dyadobacter psychrotolerans TaxID=2541721 RepID=A0A4R5DGM1_9BACT|nr:XrtN system VIT domain-containing protein [Dyadobacter psychrotolerans]TDE13172.1 XrtN system VIT domain-containing protein [Dyadobacter psychrotolerans]
MKTNDFTPNIQKLATPPVNLNEVQHISQASAARISAFTDRDHKVGLICLLLSCIFFILFSRNSQESISLISDCFVLNYCIAICYTILLLGTGKLKFIWMRQKREFQLHRLLLGAIWLVSCFSLNVSIQIFCESTAWLSVTIVISLAAMALYAWRSWLLLWQKRLLFFLLGFSTVLWTYYSICLVWFYPFAIPALILLGISVHAFVPLFVVIILNKILFQNWKKYKLFILAGIILPIFVIVYFSNKWTDVTYEIQNIKSQVETGNQKELPAWIRLGQMLKNGTVTDKVILGNLINQVSGEGGSFVPQRNNLEDLQRHDPLVLIASYVSRRPDLSREEQTGLMNVLFDGRHYTQDRLWSGQDLRIKNINTSAKIYPEYRLAYTEKLITVKNHSKSLWRPEEALFTFYLPEGSVVSSLSLWMNGKEEKGYLTTQAKADSAYKTIVGVEQRDPSVIHWQEGNTVKMRVFPCTPKQDRSVKIGITSPLKYENGRLTYQNITFRGLQNEDANENIAIDFGQHVSNLNSPFGTETISGVFRSKGKYKPEWELSFAAPPLSKNSFSFNKKSYLIEADTPKPETFSPETFFLDINAQWTKIEFDQIYDLIRNKNPYVYDDKFTALNTDNKDKIFERLAAKRYTLFPIHKIPAIKTSLLITKGTLTSPNLKDLSGSPFSDSMSRILPNTPPLRTFVIGNQLSPYQKTLSELRIIRPEKAGLSEIKQSIISQHFPADPEVNADNDSPVVKIEPAGIIIRESKMTSSGNAPDHLARLFAYSHIMQEIGRNYLNPEYLKNIDENSPLVEQALKANIVTPVSSLIVLERTIDYERFNIQKSKNSLDNATLKRSGAVPEPHEWALILVFIIMVTYFLSRNYVR